MLPSAHIAGLCAAWKTERSKTKERLLKQFDDFTFNVPKGLFTDSTLKLIQDNQSLSDPATVEPI
jgi:hypothetical protein